MKKPFYAVSYSNDRTEKPNTFRSDDVWEVKDFTWEEVNKGNFVAYYMNGRLEGVYSPRLLAKARRKYDYVDLLDAVIVVDEEFDTENLDD